MLKVFTALLIVACPCALALAVPFTYGNMLRLLSKQGFFIKNIDVLDDIQAIDHVVFDKTGTITDNQTMQLSFCGTELSEEEQVWIKSTCLHSNHPLSKAIVLHLQISNTIEIDRFRDDVGLGITSYIGTHEIRVGSEAYIYGHDLSVSGQRGVFVEIDGQFRGYFAIEQQVRDGISSLISYLKEDHKLSVISGDSDSGGVAIAGLFPHGSILKFGQSPDEKRQYIDNLQSNGQQVMMIGDGLNDSGALMQSQVGIVIADATNNFSPACDGMLSSTEVKKLPAILRYIQTSRWIIYGAIAIAIIYNSVGLYFAITGQLSPVIAAILMPLSSITVVTYGVLASWILFLRVKG